MRRFSLSLVCLGCALVLVAGCAKQSDSTAGTGKVTTIEAGDDAHKQAQTALINAKAGDTIEFGEGNFDFTSTLSCDVDGVTIRGQGIEKTTLNFAEQGQGTGGEGILVTSKKDFIIEDLAIEDAKGDAIKVNGCDGVTFRKVRVSWTGGPKETNGAYGFYPVLSKNVLIEDCIALDAADAGIYVGQSENIIVRRNKAEHNVAGIEIENSSHADVYDNIATNNTGGILVFTLPNLPKKDGRNCRVYNNQVIENNHPNFAPKGAIVANVPAGTGIMIMANRHVEVFDNTIENNQNVNLSIVSFLATGREYKKDPLYDPFCEAIYIHDNKFAGGGDKPNGRLGELLKLLTEEGEIVPDIVYDGVVNPEKAGEDGELPAELAIRIQNNGDADFMNFKLASLNLDNPLDIKKDVVSRDLKPYEGKMPPLTPVTIAGVK